MADPLEVEVVATDRKVWTGEATMVTFSTPIGSVGIMPGHAPLLSVLRDGPVLVRPPEGDDLYIAAHSGFALVDDGKVYIMASSAELASDIDIAQAKSLLEEAEASEDGEGKERALKRAQTRLLVAEKAGIS